MKFNFANKKKNRVGDCNDLNNLLNLNHVTRSGFFEGCLIFQEKENPKRLKTCLSGYFKNIKGLYKN